MKTKTGILILGLAVSAQALATTQTFNEVWSRFKEKSKSIEFQSVSTEADEIAKNRSHRHWYPQIFLEGKSFYTDDPGASLFSKLGEKSITGTDFSPTVMNFPDLTRHEKATLAATWMLFEGGSKLAQSKYYDKNLESRSFQQKAVLLSEYSKAMAHYGQLIIIKRKTEALTPLSEMVTNTLSRYQIGSASNPLGYSGALGLKNLKIRFQGELSMLEAQRKSILTSLRTLSGTPSDFTPESQSLTEFLEMAAPMQSQEIAANENLPSPSVQAQKLGAEAMQELISAERAQFLPQVGLFAQQDIYNNTDTNLTNSKTFGVFLKWQLFSAPSYGVLAQTRAQSKALELQAENTKLLQRAEFEKNRLSQKALSEQIKLADESLKLLEEQSTVSRKLFNNGLINALQLTEVYSRRVDVINARTEMEQNLLKMTAELINYYPFEIKQ